MLRPYDLSGRGEFLIPSLTQIRQSLHEYRSLLILGSAALLAELAYAILNLSAMPMYVDKGLHEFSHYGLIFGTFLATEALSRPALGALGDRIGRKPLMVAAPAITAVTSYVTILVGGPMVVPILICLRALDGLGSSALWMNAFASIGDIVGEKNRSAAMSVLNVTYMGGMALGFLLGGAANDHFHTLHASFYLASGLFVAAFLVLLIFFPKGKLHADIHLGDLSHPLDRVKEAESKLAAKFRGLLDWLLRIFSSFGQVPDMIVMAVVTFLGMGMLTPIVKVYGIDHLGLSETQFGVAVAPIAAAMGIAAVPLGHLGDRFGKTTAVCWGLFASSIAMWILAMFRSLYLAAGAGVLIGLGFTVAFPAWNALVISSTDPRRRGEVLGAVGFAQGLAAMAGTLVGPLIYKSDALSFPKLGVVNYNVPFWISAIFISAGTVICFTWVVNKRALGVPGEHITIRQRRIVVGSAIIGLLALCAWIGWRYTMPVAPDRVAWSWVQQLGRNKPVKALKYSLAQAPGWDGRAAARAKARQYHRWIHHDEGSYQVGPPDYIGEDKASVDVRFSFVRGKEPKYETVTLCRTKPRGQWRVCGVRADE
jgi:MFS family permease